MKCILKTREVFLELDFVVLECVPLSFTDTVGDKKE